MQAMIGSNTKGKPMLAAMAGQTIKPPPVWLMRQAGRYLPEYRQLRRKAGDFMTLSLTPDLASEITLQPIRRYQLDAAIIFSDILLLPYALGSRLAFVDGLGPRLSRIRSMSDIQSFVPLEQALERLEPVYECISRTSRQLPDDVALIGFAGSPWTVATYMIIGQGKEGQIPARNFAFSNSLTFETLLECLVEGTIAHLDMQAKAGAEVLMLFDSWSGILAGSAFERYVIMPTCRIVNEVRNRHPAVPIIAFPRGAGLQYLDYALRVRPDCLALDTDVDPRWASRCIQPLCCVQGNVDPRLLVDGGPGLMGAVDEVLTSFSTGPYVFNLGHGITPDADPENVRLMIERVRNQ